MTQLIDDVAQYLQSNGLGTIGINIFEGFLPPSIDSAICIVETGGLKPDIDLPLRDPSFQVIIRDTEYDNGRAVADLVRELLHNKYNVQLINNGTYIYRVNLVSEGGHIGQDPQGRDMFSLNFQCRTRQTSDGS